MEKTADAKKWIERQVLVEGSCVVTLTDGRVVRGETIREGCLSGFVYLGPWGDNDEDTFCNWREQDEDGNEIGPVVRDVSLREGGLHINVAHIVSISNDSNE